MSAYLAEIAVWPVSAYFLISGALKGGAGNPTLIQGLLPTALGFGISYYVWGSPLAAGVDVQTLVAGYLTTGAAQMALVKVLSRASNC